MRTESLRFCTADRRAIRRGRPIVYAKGRRFGWVSPSRADSRAAGSFPFSGPASQPVNSGLSVGVFSAASIHNLRSSFL